MADIFEAHTKSYQGRRYQLSPEDRRAILDLGYTTAEAARKLRVSRDTYDALMSPHGYVTQVTIDRVRLRIVELLSEVNQERTK